MTTDKAQENRAGATARLLGAGIIAGPLFIVSSFVHAALRDGFDMIRHPASLLSVGDWGWVQIATFVLTGILYIAGAAGLRRALAGGIGRVWAPVLFVVLGIAMMAGGVFVVDPSLGFPPGAPMMPQEQSWHSVVHGFAPPFGFLALVAALVILGRRFGARGEGAWMWVTIAVAILTMALSSLPSFTGDWEAGRFNFLPLWAGVTLGYGYTSLVLARLNKT